MIRALRRGHLRIALLLAVLVPSILGLALRARRPAARGGIPAPLLAAPVATTAPEGAP